MSHTEEIDFRCLKCHKTWHETHRTAIGDDGSLSKSELMRWTLAELQTEAKNKGIDTNGLREASLVKAIREDDEIDYWSAQQLQRMPKAALNRAAKDWGIATSGRSREVLVALILREQEKDAAS